jgi:hypothetical protein
MHFGVGGDEFGRQDNELMSGARDLQMSQNLGRDELIHENPAVLRVILELDDVVIAIVRFQQMRLCAASHLPDEPAGIHRHGIGGKTRKGIN